MASGLNVHRLTVIGISLALAAMFGGCHARTIAVRPAAQAATEVERFVTYMTGHFSSAAQAAADPEFRDISLKVIRIWEGREDPRVAWLYVEQAMANDLAHPYRQRVYRVSSVPGGVQSDVFSLPAPAEVVGAWHDVSLLDAVAVRDLTIREGCSVYLTIQGDRFVGGTREQDCPSELSGAKYAISQADIGPGGMVTWDRGFDASGKQVWGSSKGGYRFEKLAATTAVSGEILPAK